MKHQPEKVNILSGLLRTVFWNDANGRARVPWLIAVPLIGAYAATLIASEVAVGLVPLPLAQVFISGASVAAALALLVVNRRFLGDSRDLAGYGVLISRRWLLELGVGLIIGLAGVAIPVAIGMAVGWVNVVSVLDPGEMSLLPGIVLAVLAMLCTGFWEELVLRGVFVTNTADGLRRWFSPRWAAIGGVAVSSLVFGLAHLEQPEVPAFILTWILAGIVFGIIYVCSGSLALGIGAHATFNIAANVVFVRTDIIGTEQLSAIVRIAVDPSIPSLGFGGVLEAAGFLTVLALALVWIGRKKSAGTGLLALVPADRSWS